MKTTSNRFYAGGIIMNRPGDVKRRSTWQGHSILSSFSMIMPIWLVEGSRMRRQADGSEDIRGDVVEPVGVDTGPPDEHRSLFLGRNSTG